MAGQGEFSLYSTDTEDQVSSAHHGLNRCASLLATLLSPEKNAESAASIKQSKEKYNTKQKFKVSVPRQMVTPSSAKCSITTAGKVNGHHVKEPPQSCERKTKLPRQQDNRHSRTSSKKILPCRSKPRSRKGLVQLLNKSKEEPKGNSKVVQDKAKQLSHHVTPTTSTPTTHALTTHALTDTANSHFTTANTKVCSLTTDNKLPRVSSSSAKSTAVNGGTSETKSFQSYSAIPPSSSVPQPQYYPSLAHHQQSSYYMPTYQHHPPVHLSYPYPYHPYRYSPVPVYVADVTRRYNEMYGHHSGINGVYGGQHYQQHFGGVPRVCDASTQSLPQLPSFSSGDGAGNKILSHHSGVVKAGSESVLLSEGKTNGVEKETKDMAADAKQLVIVQELLGVLKKKLEGCQLDGITEVVEKLDKAVSSGSSDKTSLLLHADTLWALQSPTSAADWLSRLQKKDKEKKELEKKLQESYQESSKLTVQLQENVDTVECLRKQVDVLKVSQSVNSEELETTNNKIIELTQLKNKTMKQLEECLSDINSKGEEITQVKEHLKATRNRLEEVEEEYQMLKLSLTRREEELTAALDKNLGYQQCLASIVASLVGNRLPGRVGYKVNEPLMKRLQVLLKDRNVDGFLRFSNVTDQSLELTTDSQDLTGVTELTLTPPARISSVCYGPISFTEAYRAKAMHGQPCSFVTSNSSSGPPQEAFSLGGCDSSCDTFSKIMADKSNQTSLTAASEVEFRNNLAILDADIAKLQLQFQIAKSSTAK